MRINKELAHKALSTTFAHVVAETGEFIGGRNLIAHVEKAGESVPMTIHGHFLVLEKMEEEFHEECGRAIMESCSCSSAELGYDYVDWVDSWVESTYDIKKWYDATFN